MRLLSDAEFREAVATVRDELIDNYVAGELEGEEREGFEKSLKSAPGLLQKVEFARTFGEYVGGDTARDAASAREAPDDSGRRAGVFTRARGLSALVPLAAAALIILAAGLFYWLTVYQKSSREPPPLLADQRQLFEKELARVNRPPGADPLPGAEQHAASVIFTLPPREVLVRGEDGAETVAIPESPGVVQLRLELAAGDARSYRALVQTDESGDLAAVNALTLSTDGGGRAVVLNLPGRFTPPGGYQVRLYAETADGRYVEVGLYPFRTVKPK